MTAPKPSAPLQIAFCFPDVYEVGMSNLGIRILYDVLNARDDTSCERCFCPWPDFGEGLKQQGVPLFSLESRKPLGEFDIVAFSVQYELALSNVLYMLKLAGIPPLRKDRTEKHPIIMLGGPCAVNPELFSEFCDVINVGEGEEQLPALAECYLDAKRTTASKAECKALFLKNCEAITGEYVPSLNPQGSVHPVRRAVIEDLDKAYFPTKPMIANIEAVHDRGVIELFRGCTRGCRFCQAGFIYRPIRERDHKTLLHQAECILKNTGYGEMSLSSLSSGDYSQIHELVEGCKELAERYNATFALPSLRVDSFDAEMVAESRLSSLTFAPEAGTQRLRNVINKNVTEQNILDCCESAFRSGYNAVKLYFMIGLPTETDEDVAGIVDLARKVKERFRAVRGNLHRFRLAVSTSTFIPKPFTPFQWSAHIDREETLRKQKYLKTELKNLGVEYRYHDAKTSHIEAIFARGDARLAPAILRACELGAKFDGWSEFFKHDIWMQAFRECGIDPDDYTRAYGVDEALAWDFVEVGVSKEFLLREREKAFAATTTDDCRNGCIGCGVTRIAKCAYCKGGVV